MAGEIDSRSCGQRRLDALDDVEDVRARLAADDHQHRALAVDPAGDAVVLDVVERRCATSPRRTRGAVARSRRSSSRYAAAPSSWSLAAMRVATCARRRARPWAGSTVDARRAPSRTSSSDEAHAGERRRIDLHAHRRLLRRRRRTTCPTPVDLRDLLREHAVGGVEHLRAAAASSSVSERIRIGESAGLTLR